MATIRREEGADIILLLAMPGRLIDHAAALLLPLLLLPPPMELHKDRRGHPSVLNTVCPTFFSSTTYATCWVVYFWLLTHTLVCWSAYSPSGQLASLYKFTICFLLPWLAPDWIVYDFAHLLFC
jgi:hypothetical protein